MKLADLEIFAKLSAEQRSKLTAAVTVRSLSTDEPLFAQGDPADCCYVVLEGQVAVDLAVHGRDPERVSLLKASELFGEVALLDGRPRSASCSAGSTGARVAQLARSDFDRLFEAGDPAARALMDHVLEGLVGRLRGATAMLLKAVGDPS